MELHRTIPLDSILPQLQLFDDNLRHSLSRICNASISWFQATLPLSFGVFERLLMSHLQLSVLCWVAESVYSIASLLSGVDPRGDQRGQLTALLNHQGSQKNDDVLV